MRAAACPVKRVIQLIGLALARADDVPAIEEETS
jgi:hypothetical protein